jgi:hypothetical protein
METIFRFDQSYSQNGSQPEYGNHGRRYRNLGTKSYSDGMDCDYGQGFLLSKPMDVKMIEEYLEGEQNDMEEISS